MPCGGSFNVPPSVFLDSNPARSWDWGQTLQCSFPIVFSLHQNVRWGLSSLSSQWEDDVAHPVQLEVFVFSKDWELLFTAEVVELMLLEKRLYSNGCGGPPGSPKLTGEAKPETQVSCMPFSLTALWGTRWTLRQVSKGRRISIRNG